MLVPSCLATAPSFVKTGTIYAGAAHGVDLQVVRLHDRSSALLAELEELKTARTNRSAASVSDVSKGNDQAIGAAEAAARAAACSNADKELMLKQIDSLKEVSLAMYIHAST